MASQYIAEPDLPKRDRGACAGGPFTEIAGIENSSCIKLLSLLSCLVRQGYQCSKDRRRCKSKNAATAIRPIEPSNKVLTKSDSRLVIVRLRESGLMPKHIEPYLCIS